MDQTVAIVDENRWRAVLARDARQDGMFVFAVRSTGIYCRPSCPARRPGRHQVEFFPIPKAAERAGFRACRRCRPQEARTIDAEARLVQSACRYIEEHLDAPLTLAMVGRQTGRSAHRLHRAFRRVLGLTPREYVDAARLAQVKAALRARQPITDALYGAGYGSSSRLYERAPARLGMTPATYRRGGLGVRLAYTIAASPLGRLLIAATAQGICGVRLGDEADQLEAGLRAEYPAAVITRDDIGLRPWAQAIEMYFHGERLRPDLPLDIQATAFQRRVWDALRAIPCGTTRSYKEIAGAIGQPSAVRAVAQACAKNPVALVIPCHRVINANGNLGGYRWGVARKRALLDLERAAASARQSAVSR
jgi:AraC family transcriptional regulator, regulatory protein of adaptative response / methylated-DNA-[protein]-cysteine methyltransferase